MIAEKFDTNPVISLLDRHRVPLQGPVRFQSIDLQVDTQVFNPTLTKVSGFLASHVVVQNGAMVLDMFCGSGAIGLTQVHKAKKLIGVDISPLAIDCSRKNAELLGVANIAEFREGNLWAAVGEHENFDIIVANPPLLPATPETLLEMAVADSPDMLLTKNFIAGIRSHLRPGGHALMAFSNACSVYVGDPITFVGKIAKSANLSMQIMAEWDVGYELYRVLEFRR